MPLIAETLILCLLAYLVGIGLGWLLVRRHRRLKRPFLER
jgi:NhaP-type Na+/H+ or K+/H+ antiporter